MAAPSILEAMDAPAAWGPLFAGPSWRPWKAFLAALFALPMDDGLLNIYHECTGRHVPPTEQFEEAALVVGRRGGKSQILALVAVYLGVFRSYDAVLSPGEVATIAIIAAGRSQARSILGYIGGLLDTMPVLAAQIKDRTAESISLKNRVVFEIHTASFRVTRGYTLAGVLADETAFWRDESSANPDVEIFRALRPGMGTIPGAILLNASSPYRKAGALFQTYKENYGRDDASVLVWQAPTLYMNSGFDKRKVEKRYAEDPVSAAQEYGAEFRSDLADFVSREAVDACIEPGCHERPPRLSSGFRYVGFVDASAGSGSDSMTCAVAHLEDGVPHLDALRERRPPFSPDDVVDEFAVLFKSYRITRAEADKWGGDWVGEAFRKRGIEVMPTARPKAEIYRELLPMLNAHRCSLLDLPRLISQICGLERRTSRSGKDTIDHPVGLSFHDDVANAAAGALVLASAARQPFRIPAELLARI